MNNCTFRAFAIGALAGATAGGVVALLFAPKSGTDTRAFIGEKLEDLNDTVNQKIASVRQSMGEKISVAGEKISGDGN